MDRAPSLHTLYPDMAPELWSLFIDVIGVFIRETGDWTDRNGKERVHDAVARAFCTRRPPIPVTVNVRCDCPRCLSLLMSTVDWSEPSTSV